MSLLDAASAELTWKPQHLKVSRTDRSLLVEPPLAMAEGDAIANRRLLETDRVNVQGRSLALLREWSRKACLSSAHEFTRSLAGCEVAEPDVASKPIFVAGHQPSLYHPGVWVKNFGIDRLAKAAGGLSLNLIVDNDTLGSTSLRVPTGTRAEPSITRVPFDAAVPVQPWEDASIVDPETFHSFGDRITKEMSGWGIHPLIAEIWDDAVGYQGTSSRLCDCLSAARHRQERRWGVNNLELPISRMCQTDPFLWFASHVLAQLPKFRECHNRVLAEYRRLNRVRSRNHPVPELREVDGWLEAPFWVWREGESQRRGVFARQDGREVHLSDGEETFARLPLSPEMDACCAVEVLKELPSQGLRFRTRALTTTLFARLCLGDLFVHGIGGAKYDEMTDQIIRAFFGLEPPAFLTMSATLYLPMAQPHDVDEADARRLKELLRDLQFNADRHDLGPQATPLVEQKQRLIAEQAASHTEGLTRRERAERRPQNRQRYDRLVEVNRQLAALSGPQREAAEGELREIESQLAANEILKGREFSFALYPAEVLEKFLTTL